MKNMKNLKIVLIATFVLILIGVGAVLSLKKISSKPKKEAINLFDEDNTNETIELLDSTNSSLDDIFGDTLSNEDKALLALTNTTEDKTHTIDVASSTNNKANTITNNNTEKLQGKQPLTNNTYSIIDNESANQGNKQASSTTTDKYSSDYYYDEGDKNFPPTGNNVSFDPKKVNIKSFIIDYNKTLTVTRDKPIFITVVIKTPENAKYAKVRVYARRLSAKNEILSRDLIFALPRIRVTDGQTQTQFYFIGKRVDKKQLMKGRYLLYAEAEVTDKNGKSVGKTGRYPLPKWDYVVTLK